ncbi:unnamed protein product, partial [Didymodactylos carnosus]
YKTIPQFHNFKSMGGNKRKLPSNAICGNIEHDKCHGAASYKLFNLNHRHISQKVINALKEQDLLKSQANFLCNLCVSIVSEQLSEDNERPNKRQCLIPHTNSIQQHIHIQTDPSDSMSFYVNVVSKALRDDKLSEEDKLVLFDAVGINIKNQCKNDNTLRDSIYNISPETLESLSTTVLAKFIPSSILKLLNQVFILQNYQQSADSQPTQICKIYEMLFSASNGNCIMPLSFSESLMIYLFTIF